MTYRTDADVATIVCARCAERVSRDESIFTSTGDLLCRRCDAYAVASKEVPVPLLDISLPRRPHRVEHRSWSDFVVGLFLPWALLAGMLKVLFVVVGATGSSGGTAFVAMLIAWPVLVLGLVVVPRWRGRVSLSNGVAVGGAAGFVGVVLVLSALGSGMSRAL